MRTPPVNVIATAALGLVLWVATSFLTAEYLGDQVVLNELTLTSFLLLYRLALAGAAMAGLSGALMWMVYGARPQRALELDRARRRWITLFLGELALSAGVVAALLVRLLAESLSAQNVLFLFVMMSLHTWVVFWLASLLFSPRTVRYVPWLSR